MGKDLKGKELGKGLGQRKEDGLYYARCRNYRGERTLLQDPARSQKLAARTALSTLTPRKPSCSITRHDCEHMV